MAILDFIKNRQAAQQQSAAPLQQPSAPENAKEMYRQKDVQEKAALKPFDGMPKDQQAALDTIKARMDKAQERAPQGTPAPTSAPSDASASPEASRQKMSSQDKAAPDLSPTSLQAGKTGQEKDASSPAAEQPSAGPEKASPANTPSPTPTPRGRGGWER